MKKICFCKSCNSNSLKIIAKDVFSFGFTFDIVQCEKCKLRFRNIELDLEETQKIYSDNYFLVEQKDYFFNQADFKKKVFEERMKLVQKYSQKGDLLDLGSAVGVFLEVAKNFGWNETGIEISSLASAEAKNKGLNSLNRDFKNLDQLEKIFDVITLWDVVDHSEKPLELLKEVRKIVKPNGYIFVETTVIDSLMFQGAEMLYDFSGNLIKKPFLKGYPVHHSNYYSENSLRNDIEKAGFEVKESVRETFGNQIFAGNVFSKFLFKTVEAFSKIFHKEIVCILVARAK